MQGGVYLVTVSIVIDLGGKTIQRTVIGYKKAQNLRIHTHKNPRIDAEKGSIAKDLGHFPYLSAHRKDTSLVCGIQSCSIEYEFPSGTCLMGILRIHLKIYSPECITSQ